MLLIGGGFISSCLAVGGPCSPESAQGDVLRAFVGQIVAVVVDPSGFRALNFVICIGYLGLNACPWDSNYERRMLVFARAWNTRPHATIPQGAPCLGEIGTSCDVVSWRLGSLSCCLVVSSRCNPGRRNRSCKTMRCLCWLVLCITASGRAPQQRSSTRHGIVSARWRDARFGASRARVTVRPIFAPTDFRRDHEILRRLGSGLAYDASMSGAPTANASPGLGGQWQGQGAPWSDVRAGGLLSALVLCFGVRHWCVGQEGTPWAT